MIRVLFVDDEPNVLEGLRRMLHPMRHEWGMEFAQNGLAALERMERAPFDVIVSDMRMPGMNGAQLLEEVSKRYPQTIRLILSGQSSKEAILKTVGPTHQFLSKPCDTETLKSAIKRACALRDLLTNETLKQLVTRMKSLPSLPSLYLQIVEALQSEDPSIQKVSEIISKDLGMSAKILQLVNSSFFGLYRPVADLTQAITFLGTDTIRALVLSVHIFSQSGHLKLGNFSMDTLSHHSTVTGVLAKRIAEAEKVEQTVADAAFVAGLLHDTGKLVLACNLPEQYRKALALAKERQIPLWEAEREIFGSTHAEVGACLLGLWGLPDPIVEAVAWHHRPTECPSRVFCPLTAVYVADVLEEEAHPDNETTMKTQVDTNYLTELGLGERLPVWREISCGMQDT